MRPTVMPIAQPLRFMLELCALAALGSWGWQSGPTLPIRLGLGIGAALLATVVWGLFVAPTASIAVPGAVRLVIEVAIFGLAVLGLLAVGRSTLALALGIAYVVHRVLLIVADQ